MTASNDLPNPPRSPEPVGDTHSAESAEQTVQRVLASEELLAGETEVRIRHAGEIYRLRLTQKGKLILQK